MRHENPKIDQLRALSEANRLYFGYGSNLNAKDYKTQGRKELKFLCPALAPDVSLVFDRKSVKRKGGVLSLKDTPGAMIDGLLVEVDETNWRELDDKEGVASGCYARITIRVLVWDHDTRGYQEILAQTYVATNPDGFHPPSEEYLQICTQGRETHGLSTRDLKAAAENRPNGFAWQNQNIFTYGTLCRGECREPVMRSCPLNQVGLAVIHGMRLFRNAGEAYPCLLLGSAFEPSVPVIGDLWSFRGAKRGAEGPLCRLFRELDAIEGDERPTLLELVKIARAEMRSADDIDASSKAARQHLENAMANSLFRRTLVQVEFSGRARSAWTYLYACDTSGLLQITSGNWRKYVGRWESFLQSLASSYIEKAGGVEAFRAIAANDYYTGHLASVLDDSDLARMLDDGQADERELVIKLGLMNNRAG